MSFEKAKSERSLETEIPYRQVRELFSVNHFIVSQASPYMAPWLDFKESIQDRSSLAAKVSKSQPPSISRFPSLQRL
jgi:hypothetical protein